MWHWRSVVWVDLTLTCVLRHAGLVETRPVRAAFLLNIFFARFRALIGVVHTSLCIRPRHVPVFRFDIVLYCVRNAGHTHVCMVPILLPPDDCTHHHTLSSKVVKKLENSLKEVEDRASEMLKTLEEKLRDQRRPEPQVSPDLEAYFT